MNSSNIKISKLEELLNSEDEYEFMTNNPTNNMNSLNNIDIPSKSDFENKGSIELELNSKNKSKTKEKNKDLSLSKRHSQSFADIAVNINNNNNSSSNQTSSSQKTFPKPFNKNGLLNKSQLKLASYIEKNKDITLIGTKRFTDKSGEYYLKNVQLQKKQDKTGPLSKKLSLNHPQNLDNCFDKLNGNINKIRRNATKIITILPENSLTPIPVKEQNSVRGMAQAFNKKQYQNAERVAVFIRRMEYSNGVNKHFKANKKDNIEDNEDINKIIFIQEWWKTIYKIISIQKCIRGFLFRKNLMRLLEHQENILKFITTFYNIHGFHLYRTFFDNLKKLCNEINSKKTEFLEDFNEKMEKIEKMNNLRKLKYKMLRWKNFVDNEIKNEKAKKFCKINYMKKGFNGLKKYYLLKLIKDTLGDDRKELFDEIFNNKNLINILKALKIIDKVFRGNNNKTKKEIFQRFKLFYLMNILKNICDRLKKESLDKINEFYEYFIKKSAFKKWKEIINLNKILENLKIKKKEEIENNRNLLFKTLLNWKALTDIKNLINLMNEYKKKENNISELISKLNKIYENIKLDNIRKAFELLKNFWKENKMKKQQFKKLKIKLVKKESNPKIEENINNNINNQNNLNELELLNQEKNPEENNKLNEEEIKLKKTKTYLNNNFNNQDNNIEENEKNTNASPKRFKKRISYRNRIKKKKKSKKDKLKTKLAQLKKISLMLLIRIYKNFRDKLIKKYFDKWKNNKDKSKEKYIKKVILGNTLNKSKDSKLSDNSKRGNLEKNNLTNNDILSEEINKKINPDKIFDKLQKRKEQILDNIEQKKNSNNNEKDIDSDDTSVNISRMSGIHLEEVKSENLKPIIYTSQSFIIDKNTINDIQKELPQLSFYKNINNKYPMKMKGDFGELINKNKDLLKNKNPRIQITNATCELEQFSPPDTSKTNTNINNINILNLNPNISINMNKTYKKKDLKKVVKNCDKDIYQPNKDYDKEKQRWISMSIPLDDDMANWEFLDSVKGIRKKNNINKFEIIQKNKFENNNTYNSYEIKDMNPKKKKFNENFDIKNNQYQLTEMNYKTYYKSLINDEEINFPIKLIRNTNNKSRKLNHKIFSVDINNRKKYINNDIEELPEESFE